MRARRAGAKRREDIYAAFESIYPVLQEFRKGDVDPTLRPPPVPAQLPPPVRMGATPCCCWAFIRDECIKVNSECQVGPMLQMCKVLSLSVLQRREPWSRPICCPCKVWCTGATVCCCYAPLRSARGPTVL